MKKFMLHKAGKANADCINVARLGKVEAQNNKSNQHLLYSCSGTDYNTDSKLGR